jgi:MFS family permease
VESSLVITFKSILTIHQLWILAQWSPFLKSGRLVRRIGFLLYTSCSYPVVFLVTSIAAGQVGDIIGRRGTLFIGAIIFTIGGAIQTFTVGFWSMVLGRIVSGFGVGLLSWVLFFLFPLTLV